MQYPRKKKLVTSWIQDRWILLALALVLLADVACAWWKISQYNISIERMVFPDSGMGTVIMIEPK